METYYAKTYETRTLYQNIEMIVLSVVCFMVPFVIGHPQWVVGVIVNTALVLAALNLPGNKWIPVAILPSLGVVTKGIIFGPFTPFLLIMIPFIWIGNSALILTVKYLVHKKNIKLGYAVIPAALGKAAILFSSAYLLVSFGAIPVLFVTTMGMMQLYTALTGGVVAVAIHTIREKYLKKDF